MDEHETRRRNEATRRVGRVRAVVVGGALATSLAATGAITLGHATSTDEGSKAAASTTDDSSTSSTTSSGDTSSLVTSGSSSSSHATTSGS